MKLRILFSLFALLMMGAVNAQINTVGLIGSATPGGWDADTNMVQDAVDPNLWTLSIELIDGAAKFRANDAWDINWGDFDFPVGVGTQGGPDIPVRAGSYEITFNSGTGAYYFSVASDIGILGSAAPFGWDSDVNLFQDDIDTNLYTVNLNLSAGDVKFRQFDAWDINWGSLDWPSGVGVQNGDNIPVPAAGEYAITFNKATGEYSFTLISFSTVGIIGSATPGGDVPTPLNVINAGDDWAHVLVLTDGGLQFTGENGLVVWGGGEFPADTAVIGGGDIPVTAGRYFINFNSETLVYSFEPVTYYPVISIIGDATPGGWVTDTDMEVDLGAPDSSFWKLRVVLTDGFLKFRANHDWAVNWGSDAFPTGIATLDGPDIPVTAGEYNIFFNTFSGEFEFFELRIYDSVGMVGTATPLMSWDIDVQMEKDDVNENLWTIPLITMNDGFAKFRAEGNWTINWGSTDFPAGIGTQDGPDIPVVAGTYGVTINTETGEYLFGEPLSTQDVLDPGSIKLYPNPASEIISIDLSAIDLTGKVTLRILDMTGKLMLLDVQEGSEHMQMNVSSLTPGHYLLQMSNDKYIIGKKLSVVK